MRELRPYREVPLDQFMKDTKMHMSAQRALEIAINSCIDVGAHVVYLGDVPVPENYSQIFEKLHELQVISKPLNDALVKMVKFRNFLGHFYLDVDNQIVFTILRESLDDFSRFKHAIFDRFKDDLEPRE